jgi:hypothetical protein
MNEKLLRIFVDINTCESSTRIAIPTEGVPVDELKVGRRVILFEPGMECEAVLQRGTRFAWVAEIVPGTVKEAPA